MAGVLDEPAVGRPTLRPLAPRTLVDQAVDAIVRGAAEGHFLPGDRLVEAELARTLGVSRVPVREALRLLESQGIVVNIPYRGMRLMDVNQERIERILENTLGAREAGSGEAPGAASRGSEHHAGAREDRRDHAPRCRA